MIFEKKGNLFIGRFADLFGAKDIFHGFSTRRGGVSKTPYDSLNLGFNTQDNPDDTRENRRLFFETLELDPNKLAVAVQIHGTRIGRVKSPGFPPETDALVTDVPSLALVVQVADCVPIFLYDPVRRAVGLIHAGWKGSAEGIASSTVRFLRTDFGIHPEDTKAFIGPSIGPCCYEVGPEVGRRFSSQYLVNGRLDLWRWNYDLLLKAGLKPENVRLSRICTACHTDWFFSHRVQGVKTGRMMAVIGMTGNGC
jgi:YfiH family protein